MQPIKNREYTKDSKNWLQASDTDWSRTLEVVHPDARAHWRRSGSGYAHVEFKLHKNARWLEIDTIEHADTGSSKRTMMTLAPHELEALRLMLMPPVEPEPVLASPLTCDQTNAEIVKACAELVKLHGWAVGDAEHAEDHGAHETGQDDRNRAADILKAIALLQGCIR